MENIPKGGGLPLQGGNKVLRTMGEYGNNLHIAKGGRRIHGWGRRTNKKSKKTHIEYLETKKERKRTKAVPIARKIETKSHKQTEKQK